MSQQINNRELINGLEIIRQSIRDMRPSYHFNFTFDLKGVEPDKIENKVRSTMNGLNGSCGVNDMIAGRNHSYQYQQNLPQIRNNVVRYDYTYELIKGKQWVCRNGPDRRRIDMYRINQKIIDGVQHIVIAYKLGGVKYLFIDNGTFRSENDQRTIDVSNDIDDLFVLVRNPILNAKTNMKIFNILSAVVNKYAAP